MVNIANIGYKLEVDKSSIEQVLSVGLYRLLGNRLDKKKIDIIKDIRNIFLLHFQRHPTYESLLSGELQGEFGLTDSKNKLDIISNAIAESLKIVVQQVSIKGGKLKGGLIITSDLAEMSNVLASPAAVQSTEKGQQLPWLEWLLYRGDTQIVREYQYVKSARHSRTGKGIMRKNVKRTWGVPPQYAGVAGKNFLTEVFDNANQDIIQYIKSNMEKF